MFFRWVWLFITVCIIFGVLSEFLFGCGSGSGHLVDFLVVMILIFDFPIGLLIFPVLGVIDYSWLQISSLGCGFLIEVLFYVFFHVLVGWFQYFWLPRKIFGR
jgi:hypothetical protein